MGVLLLGPIIPALAQDDVPTNEARQAVQKATKGTIPNQIYPSSHLFTQISAQMSSKHHNQPAVIHGYVLLAGNAEHEFWDISDPYHPVRLSEFRSPHNGGEAESHQISFAKYSDGRLLLATTSGRGIDLWDITDPSAPQLLNALVLADIRYGDNTEAVWGISWQGNHIYVGGTNTGLHIVDATDPTNPTVINRIPTATFGNVSAGPLFAVGNLLVMTTPKNSAGIVTLDISDPERPFLLDVLVPTSNTSSYIGGFYGRYATLLRPYRIYDVTTDPSQIQEIGRFNEPHSEYVSFGDGYLYLGELRGGTEGIWKYDLTNPNEPLLVGRVVGRDARWDDQFSVPVGNLLIVSDDQHVNGFVGSYVAVHDTDPDTQPPEVLYTNPINGATEQALTTRIALSFSDQIELSSVNNRSFTVRPVGGQPIHGRWGLNQTILNFWPDHPLQPNTTYEVRLPAGGIADLVGNGIDEEFISTFTTKSTLDNSLGPDEAFSCTLLPPAPTAVGITVTLSATALGPTTTYLWDLGDGSQAVGQRVTHVYDKPGRYPVVLTVSSANLLQSESFEAESATLNERCAATQIVHRPLTQGGPMHSTTIFLDEADKKVWVVNPDSNSVTAVAADSLSTLFEVSVGRRPRTLAKAPDGTIWVVNDLSHNISILDGVDGSLLETIPLPYGCEPYGIVFAPDGSAAYVTLQALGSLVKIDTSSRSTIMTTILQNENLRAQQGSIPKVSGLAISHDSTHIFVTRFISPDSGGEVYRVDASSMTLQATVPLANDPGPDTPDSGRGIPNYLGPITISPDGRKAWIPSKKDNMDRGRARDGQALTHDSMVRPIVSQIDLLMDREDLSARVDLNDADSPVAAASSPHGDLLFVALQGINRVTVLDAYSGLEVASMATGLAPQGLALGSDGRLYVQNFLDRTLSVFDVTTILDGSDLVADLLATIKLVEIEPLTDQILQGKQIFYNAADSRMGLEGYISCASCHIEGDHDGRVWDFTDRGEGLRNTISLLGRGGVKHGPLHWTGNFDEIQDFESDIRLHFDGTGFIPNSAFNVGTRRNPLGDSKVGVSPELDALAAYVSSLKNIPASAHRTAKGRLTPSAQAGRALFVALNCSTCHSGNNYTDSALNVWHDVGTIQPTSGSRIGSVLRGFDTPTLKGLAISAPYLHNGSAATLFDVINHPQHGNASVLNSSSKGDLAAYLLSIDESIELGLGQAVPYEAEAAYLSGGVAARANHFGYSDLGYVDYPNHSGSHVFSEWWVHLDSSTVAQLTFRYANGDIIDRPLTLIINERIIQTVHFDPTTSWDQWQDVTIEHVALTAGRNAVRLVADHDLGPNIDYLRLTSESD